MLSQFMYPIICSEKFSQTVAFYEDHFDYHVAMEMEGFVIMQRADWNDPQYAGEGCYGVASGSVLGRFGSCM